MIALLFKDFHLIMVVDFAQNYNQCLSLSLMICLKIILNL